MKRLLRAIEMLAWAAFFAFALLVLAVPIGTATWARAGGGAVAAYLAGAVGVLLLGGREGATINYFLDLSAALALTATTVAPRLSLSARYPIASVLQIMHMMTIPFSDVIFMAASEPPTTDAAWRRSAALVSPTRKSIV